MTFGRGRIQCDRCGRWISHKDAENPNKTKLVEEKKFMCESKLIVVCWKCHKKGVD